MQNQSKVITTSAKYRHGQSTIVIQQTKPAIKLPTTPSVQDSCGGSIKIINGEQKVKQINLPEMVSHGGSYGIFVPNQPVNGNYFTVVKQGSDNGIIYLVKKNGAVQSMAGGPYFVSADQRYLFSTHSNDCDCGASVFDLKKGKLLTSTNSPSIVQWYQKAGAYFFTTNSSQKDNVVYYFDPVKPSLIQAQNIPDWKQGAKPIHYTFDPSAYQQCHTGNQIHD